MSENSTIGGRRGRRGRARAARTARTAGAVAAAAVAIGGTSLLAGAAPAAATGGAKPRAFLSIEGKLQDVTAISVSNAWAVGQDPSSPVRPILAHWDGKKWAQVKSPTSLGELDAVAKFPGGAWAVGNSGGATEHLVLLRLTGMTARRTSTPNVGGGALFDVAATSATNAWAVGQTNGGQSLVLHWNGTKWTRTPLPAGSRRDNLFGVAATSTANAWTLGGGPQGDNILLHWNGKQWSRSALPVSAKFAFLRTVSATSATNAWVVGGEVILHWNGKKWTVLPNPKPLPGTGPADFLSLAASSARNAWAVGQVSQQFIPVLAHWNGTSWTSVAAPVATGQLEGVAISPSGNAWAVGKSADARTLILHWDGKAWH